MHNKLTINYNSNFPENMLVNQSSVNNNHMNMQMTVYIITITQRIKQT